MCSKHVEAWNKLIIKFGASSWLILRNKYIFPTSLHNTEDQDIGSSFVHCMEAVWINISYVEDKIWKKSERRGLFESKKNEVLVK